MMTREGLTVTVFSARSWIVYPHLQVRYEHRAHKLALILMQALNLNVEYCVGIEGKAVVFS